jgi:hypothetical protein
MTRPRSAASRAHGVVVPASDGEGAMPIAIRVRFGAEVRRDGFIVQQLLHSKQGSGSMRRTMPWRRSVPAARGVLGDG